VPYNNLVDRTDADVPDPQAKEIIRGARGKSAAMSLFRNVPMARGKDRIRVESALPTAYFVNGDTGLKQTTESAWAHKDLVAEEIAAIVPVPENVIDDADFDIWGEERPQLEEAVGRALDAAVFFGTNKPASWPAAISPAAVAAGNTSNVGTSTAAQGGFAGDLATLFNQVEGDGYDVNALVAARSIKGSLRATRDTTGQRILEIDLANNKVDGVELVFPMRGLFPTGSGTTQVIGGDFSQGVLGVRSDMKWKILDQAVIQDNTGVIIYNLAQQDMLALRVTARFAFQVANGINFDNAVDATRYPFAVLRTP
jgi:HK97 family phage major capsid protein